MSSAGNVQAVSQSQTAKTLAKYAGGGATARKRQQLRDFFREFIDGNRAAVRTSRTAELLQRR
jgi:hypothetical protein